MTAIEFQALTAAILVVLVAVTLAVHYSSCIEEF